jgi:hypothetical protein
MVQVFSTRKGGNKAMIAAVAAWEGAEAAIQEHANSVAERLAEPPTLKSGYAGEFLGPGPKHRGYNGHTTHVR